MRARQIWEAPAISLPFSRVGHPQYFVLKMQLLNSFDSLTIHHTSFARRVLFVKCNPGKPRTPWTLSHVIVCCILAHSPSPQKNWRLGSTSRPVIKLTLGWPRYAWDILEAQQCRRYENRSSYIRKWTGLPSSQSPL